MTFATGFLVQLNGCACSFHCAMNCCSFSANSAFEAKSTMASRLRCRMLNHCSTWFIHEQCTGGWWNTKRGCLASHACTFLPLCIRRLSSTTWISVISAGMSRSNCSKKAMNSSCRFRSAVMPYTCPVRVLKAANRFKAPQRPYSCSTNTGWPGAAALVGVLRGRGCRLVFSSTHRTASWGPKAHVYRSQISWTRAAKSASRGTLGDSHRWWRHGLSWWLSKMRRTVSGEMLATTPSRTNWLANSRQSHCDSERPSLSGRSQAILTRWRATVGGKDGLAPASRLVGQALQPLGQVTLGPLAGVADGQARAASSVFEGVALVQQQKQAAASGQPLFEVGGAEPVFQFLKIAGRELDNEGRFAPAHGRRFQPRKQHRGEEPGRMS